MKIWKSVLLFLKKHTKIVRNLEMRKWINNIVVDYLIIRSICVSIRDTQKPCGPLTALPISPFLFLPHHNSHDGPNLPCLWEWHLVY